MFTRSLRRAGAAAAASAGLLVATAGLASAHECFVANRSAIGNAITGSHSAAWQTVSLHTILTEFIRMPEDLAACFEAKAPAAGLPTSFVFGGKQAQDQGGVIAENNPNFEAKGLASDGKGIDHGEDVYAGLIFQLAGECSS